MNRAAFFETANELLNWVAHLSCATECALREAEDQLCRKQQHGPNVKVSIRWDLAVIREKIEEVMTVFDMLCEAAGEEPRFELAFRVLDAPRLVQRELRRRLDGMPPVTNAQSVALWKEKSHDSTHSQSDQVPPPGPGRGPGAA